MKRSTKRLLIPGLAVSAVAVCSTVVVAGAQTTPTTGKAPMPPTAPPPRLAPSEIGATPSSSVDISKPDELHTMTVVREGKTYTVQVHPQRIRETMPDGTVRERIEMNGDEIKAQLPPLPRDQLPSVPGGK